jgi:ABC-type multidrug transport system ATPase subunit
MIDVIHLTHHYGIRPVLRDINQQIDRGELVTLMGPNGSGKTPLMAAMAGLFTSARGYVQIDGKRRRQSMEDESGIRKMIAYLPADAWIPQLRTGREWLMAVGRLYGHDDEQLMSHADRLFKLFDLESLADSRVASYSTGQKKKIALAGALISEAPVLLLDEPFSGGLDPSGILALKRVLDHLRQCRQVTIVMATPVPELVEDLTDRIAIINETRLLAFDSVDGLRRTTGCSGKLDEIYEKMINPHRSSRIEQYLKGNAQ